MHRVKHPPVRNKIDVTDAGQMRAWTKRLDIDADRLKAIVSKVGESAATVIKEIELQRSAPRPPDPAATGPGRELPAFSTAS